MVRRAGVHLRTVDLIIRSVGPLPDRRPMAPRNRGFLLLYLGLSREIAVFPNDGDAPVLPTLVCALPAFRPVPGPGGQGKVARHLVGCGPPVIERRGRPREPGNELESQTRIGRDADVI